MSEDKKRQPKPFLKRGTGQLSNATVRSLNQKPRIVEYSQNAEPQLTSNLNAVTFGKKKQDQLRVPIKKSNFKDPQIKVNSQKKTVQSHQGQGNVENTAVSVSKKIPTGLDDYLGNSGQKKNGQKENIHREKSTSVTKNKYTPLSYATELKKQQIDSSDDNEGDEEEVKPQKAVLPRAQPYRPSQNVQVAASKMPEKLNEDEEICFNSDSDPEELPKNNRKKVQTKPVPKQTHASHHNKWREDSEDQNKEEKAQSKVFQKFYQKDPSKKAPQKEAQKPKMTIESIPRQLKDQIITQYVTEKRSQIEKKLQEQQQIKIKAKQQKDRYEQLNKQLVKERADIQKRQQNMEKQRRQKFKVQEDKIKREKMYLKGHQDQARGDWKLKRQVEQLRQKIPKLEKQKKEVKVKMDNEVLRLQNKLDDLTRQNQQMKNTIKYYEKEKLESVAKAKLLENKIQSNIVEKKKDKKINYWQGAPTTSYIYDLGNLKFCLLDLDISQYDYENLQHYKYYIQRQNEDIPLEMEEATDQKITRRYANGKEETEYIRKVLKQKFPAPFGLTVVTHANGDTKLILPGGIQVYSDVRSQITEFKVSTQKTIFNFHKLGQLEMKFKHPQQGDIHELRKGSLLIRNSRKGEEKFKLLANGKIEQVY